MAFNSFSELFQQNSDASAIPVVFATDNATIPPIGGSYVPQQQQQKFDMSSDPNGSTSTGAVSKAAAASPANTDKAALPNNTAPEQQVEDPRFAEVNRRLDALETWQEGVTTWQGETTKWQGEVTTWQGEVTTWQKEITNKIDEGFTNIREWQGKMENGFQQIREWQEKFDQKHPSK